MTDSAKKPIRTWSIISGVSLLIMAISAAFAYGFVFNSLHVEGNVAGTIENINKQELLFFLGNLSWCLILLTDLIVSYGIYLFLNQYNKSLALASGLLRLLYSIILALGIVFLFQKSTQVFLYYWSMGLIIFGIHLTITGLAAHIRRAVPKLLSVLLIIAGIGYIVVHSLQIFFPGISNFTGVLEMILILPMSIAELYLAVWFIVKGGVHSVDMQ